MSGWQELNRVDLDILDAINREWHAERLQAARQERLLHGDTYKSRGRAARAVAVAVVAGLALALLVGLAVAAANGAGAQVLAGWLA